MKTTFHLPALCAALALSAPLTVQAAKPHKLTLSDDCRALAASAGTLTVEHGVTVYRAASRPWQAPATRLERPAAQPARIVLRPYRYNYLEADTRSRGEWGPVNAIYQKF